MKRIALGKREAQKIGYPKGSRAEEVRFEDATAYLKDGRPWKLRIDDYLFPWLTEDNDLKRVVIDMGAVPFIAKGADLMGPGIIEHDSPAKGELVSIIDERNQKRIAIGVVITDGIQAQGKTIRILHYAGDRHWEALKTLL